MLDKKGQVTLFVIIGIILLISVIIVLYLTGVFKTEVSVPDVNYEKTYEYELLPIENDIESCMVSLAQDALTQIGFNGGYLEVDKRTLLYDMQLEYANNALELFPGSGDILPYWYSISGTPKCVDCSYNLKKPSLEGSVSTSIQSQTQKYIDSNIIECMKDFKAYENLFDITYQEPKSKVTFRDKDTVIGLEWNITLKDLGSQTTTKMDVFNSIIDLPMKKMYDLATDVLYQLIIDQGVLDDFAIQVADYTSMGKDSKIPPRAGGTEFGFASIKVWRNSDVKKILKERISANMPYLQVFKSKDHFVMFSDNEFDQSIYDQLVKQLYTDEDQLARTKIRFNYYPHWPAYVNVNPSYGEVIMPESYSISNPLFPFSMNRYDFDYDITYPILITLEDNKAFEGKGYLFQYAVEGNARHSRRYANVQINQTEREPQDFAGGFDDPLERNIPVKIIVLDDTTLSAVENVGVLYTCVDSSVVVGSTSKNAENIELETFMPPCIGGFYSVVDPIYHSENVYENILPEENNEVIITAFKETPIEIYPKKKLLVKIFNNSDDTKEYYWALNKNTVGRDVNENITVIFTRIVNGETTQYIKIAELTGADSKVEMNLIPGDYNVMLIGITGINEFSTQEEIMEGQVIPATTFNTSLFTGYLLLDNSTSGTYYLSSENITKGKMNLYYAGFNTNQLVVSRDIGVMGEITQASTTNRELLEPEFD